MRPSYKNNLTITVEVMQQTRAAAHACLDDLCCMEFGVVAGVPVKKKIIDETLDLVLVVSSSTNI